MAVRNQSVDKNADFAKQSLHIPLVTAVSQTGVVAYSFAPGYKFQVIRIRTYCLLKAGAVAGVLKVGGRTAGTLTFTTATEVAITPSATKANVRGAAAEAITLEYTSDGSGVLTNGVIVVTIRPWPLRGEIGPN